MQAWHQFWRTSAKDCFCTVHTPLLSVLLYIQHLPIIITVTTLKQSSGGVLYKKDVLRKFAIFTGKHLYQSLFVSKVAELCNFIKKETLAQVFSSEFCENSKNTLCYITPLMAASDCFSWLLLILTFDFWSPMFVFGTNSKGFKEYKSGISFSLKSFSSVLLFFFHVFSVLLFFHFFLVVAHKKDPFRLIIH